MINRPSRARGTARVLFAAQLFFCALLATTLLDPARACASGVVTNCDEASLHAALASSGMVTFACDGAISLTSTLIITTDTVLDATGHEVLLNGNNSVRIFYVTNSASLTLINLTLANGRNTGKDGAPAIEGDPASGGGIFNDGGFVNLMGCTLTGNQAIGGTGGSTNFFTGLFVANGGSASGGAIYNRLGRLGVTNTVFLSNSTVGGLGGLAGAASGGAIFSTLGTVNLVGVTFTNNRGAGDSASGGAIFSAGGTVNLVGVTFTNNLASAGSGRAIGGAFCAVNGSATVARCGFSSNSAIGNIKATGGPLDRGTGNGGGIYHENGSLDVDETTFSSNSAVGGSGASLGSFALSGDGNGGGVFNKAGTAVLRNCLFYANRANGGSLPLLAYLGEQDGAGHGGGVFNSGSLQVMASVFSANLCAGGGKNGGDASGGAIFSDASLIVSNSAFSGNLSQGGKGYWFAGSGVGAAVYDKGSLTMVNSSFSDNSSSGGAAKVRLSGAAYGGGLSKEAGTAQIINCTFSDNRALGGPSDSVGPGGLDPPSTPGQSLGDTISVTNATVMLINTLVANSHSQSNVWGMITDGGHNLCSDASANFTDPTSRNNVDPMLAQLADNGGSTFTLALLPGSPAIDAGDDTACPPTDQRGVVRPIGSHCDIGAFEFVPRPSVVRGPNGKVRLDFVLQPSRTNTVEASTNLVDWLSLGKLTSTTNGLVEFKDQDATTFPARFYRIR